MTPLVWTLHVLSFNPADEYKILVGLHTNQIVSLCFLLIISDTMSMTSSDNHRLPTYVHTEVKGCLWTIHYSRNVDWFFSIFIPRPSQFCLHCLSQSLSSAIFFLSAAYSWYFANMLSSSYSIIPKGNFTYENLSGCSSCILHRLLIAWSSQGISVKLLTSTTYYFCDCYNFHQKKCSISKPPSVEWITYVFTIRTWSSTLKWTQVTNCIH